MHVEHFERGIRYDDQELLLLARKIGRLATYCKRLKDESSSIRVEAEQRATKKKQDAVKVMITVELPGKTLRAETRRPRALDGVERCVEKLEAQVKRYKELHSPRGRLRVRRSPRRSNLPQ